MTFDVVRYGLRPSVCFLRPTVVIQVIRPRIIESHMRPPSVVTALEFGAQGRLMIIPFDDRHASEPLVLERLDGPFSYSNGPALSHGSEAALVIAALDTTVLHTVLFVMSRIGLNPATDDRVKTSQCSFSVRTRSAFATQGNSW